MEPEPDQPRSRTSVRIALVGPCAAGKSTVAKRLQTHGYEVRQPAQEHSYVPYMWQRISKPDFLIFLDVNYEQTLARRPHMTESPARLAEQQERLAHARAHCDLYLDTSRMTVDEVETAVLNFLQRR